MEGDREREEVGEDAEVGEEAGTKEDGHEGSTTRHLVEKGVELAR